jgi:arabinogalactan endo-1,4-beta-galactosidase
MRNLICLFLAVCTFFSCSKNEETSPVSNNKLLEIKGADMSFLPEIRRSGKVFYSQKGEAEDMLLTLKKAGVNVIRLRIWKKPSEAASNFETVKNLAKEIRGLGMKTLITVHYSDSWADPSQQSKPTEWKDLNFNQLKDSVYQYTRQIMSEISPDYIQVGNEINNGLLWPDGSLSNLSQMKTLLRAAITAVRDTKPTSKIIIHYAGISNAQWFFATLSDLDYDLIGISYYPMWHGKDLGLLQQTLVSLSETNNKSIFIAETSYPFTLSWNDWTNNLIGLDSQILPDFPPTPQGQKDFLLKIKQICQAVPKGIGFCYWGSEWVSYKGNQATDGSSWENQAFWDFENKALPIVEGY